MEFSIVKFFNNRGSGFIDRVIIFITQIWFLTILWSALAIIFLYFDKKSGPVIFLAIIISLILHFIFTEGLVKHTFSKKWIRKRPYIAYPQEIKPIGKLYKDSSFPSSHLATTLAALSVIDYYHPQLWAAALFFAIFMAYARIHQGMHYFSDTLAGAGLGIIYATAGIYLANIII
jgi:membrane-associated phospholipid phosphatase